jgi:LuxR family maltose regulon positive regulatory protein
MQRVFEDTTSPLIARPRLLRHLYELLNEPFSMVAVPAGWGKTAAVRSLLVDAAHVHAVYLKAGTTFYNLATLVRQIVRSARQSVLRKECLDRALHSRKSLQDWMEQEALDEWVHDFQDQLLEAGFHHLLLVVDDADSLQDQTEVSRFLEKWVSLSPKGWHFMAVCRRPLDWEWTRHLFYRSYGNLMDAEPFRFRPDETALLAETMGCAVSREEAERVCDQTGGWPVAVVRRLRYGDRWQHLCANYLDQEIWKPATDTQRVGLLKAYCLAARTEPEEYPRVRSDLEGVLAFRKAFQVFDALVPFGFCFHQGELSSLLAMWMERHLPEAHRRRMHRSLAAVCFRETRTGWAIAHAAAARDWNQAADWFKRNYLDLFQDSHLPGLRVWKRLLESSGIQCLESVLFQAEWNRRKSGFGQALERFHEVIEASRKCNDRLLMAHALLGCGQVYVDTLQPTLAEPYLKQALKRFPQEARKERIHALSLLAENCLNLGKVSRARKIMRWIPEIRLSAEYHNHDVRVLLRTGKLEQAATVLEARLHAAGGSSSLSSMFHREGVLLLSLLYSMMGKWEQAEQMARQGIAISRKVQSKFLTAVAWIRLGHALYGQSFSPFFQCEYTAKDCYRNAIALMNEMGVQRGLAEPLMGMCLVFAREGNGTKAEETGRHAVAAALDANDLWMASLARLVLGAALVWTGHMDKAEKELKRAKRDMEMCEDAFGSAVADLWRMLARPHAAGVNENLERLKQSGYHWLLERRTLTGLQDDRQAAPLLEESPGLEYTLQIVTFGRFQVYRGACEIDKREWQRDKARQLLQYLVVNRSRWVHREEMMAALWPGVSSAAAYRNFKVALHSVMKVCETGRKARTESSLIARNGCFYRLLASPALVIDADRFETAAVQAWQCTDRSVALQYFREATRYYRGDFLPDSLYEEWCLEERERLQVIYLRCSERMAQLQIEEGLYQEAVDTAEKILRADPCWEEAYRILMRAYHFLGNRTMVLRTWERCKARIGEQLRISPMEETRQLLQELL